MSDEKHLAALAKMKRNRPTWITWQNGSDTMMESTDPAYDGHLVFKKNGRVLARYSEAGQIKKDYSNARTKAKITKKSIRKCDETGVKFDDDFLRVHHLMRLQEQGIDFAALGSDPYSEKSIRWLVNNFANVAWRLLAMVADGDSEGLIRFSNLVELRKKIASTPPQRKELSTIARAIGQAAAIKWKESGEIKPPTFADVIHICSPKSDDEETEIRRKMREAGFGWLPKKWQRKT
jgi:hypothetical protein